MHIVSDKGILFLAGWDLCRFFPRLSLSPARNNIQGQDVSQQGVNQGFPPFTESYHFELKSANTLGTASPSAELKKQLLGLLRAASSSSDLNSLQIRKPSKFSPSLRPSIVRYGQFY